VTLDRVQSLAKAYFRDSAEVPMNVEVSTVVTDPAGKTKHSARSAVQMLFHGYSLQGHKFNLKGNSGWFNTWALRDSIPGDLAAFWAPLFLTPGWDPPPAVEAASRPGDPVAVSAHNPACQPFQIMPPTSSKFLFPGKPCDSRDHR